MSVVWPSGETGIERRFAVGQVANLAGGDTVRPGVLWMLEAERFQIDQTLVGPEDFFYVVAYHVQRIEFFIGLAEYSSSLVGRIAFRRYSAGFSNHLAELSRPH